LTATQGEEQFIASKCFHQCYEAILAILVVADSFERLKRSQRFMTNDALHPEKKEIMNI
jgi:hypothetical protein